VPEIKTPLIKINFRKSESVIVMDVNDLPAEYKVVKVTEQADKVKIKDALKKGEQILGCELVINQNIQIK
jgi:methylthioribose-1-phosphate isomerase